MAFVYDGLQSYGYAVEKGCIRYGPILCNRMINAGCCLTRSVCFNFIKLDEKIFTIENRNENKIVLRQICPYYNIIIKMGV